MRDPTPPTLRPALARAVVAAVLVSLVGCAAPPAGTSPVATVTPAVSDPPPESPTPGEPSPTPDPTFVTHVVAAGDTLEGIARRYRTTVPSLIAWNRERYPTLDPAHPRYDPNRIQVGWKLRVLPGHEVPFNTARPTPTAPPETPTPAPGGAATVVTHVADPDRVALTFDLTGRVGDAVQIVRWLADHDVRATIFVSGQMASTSAGADVLALVESYPLLFDLGSGGQTQRDLRPLDPAAVAAEIRSAEGALLRVTERSPRPFFRPPAGGWDDEVLTAAGAQGYRYVVLWDLDALDWQARNEGGPDAAGIATRVRTAATGGSVIRLSLGGFQTLSALPGVVDALRARRLRPVTLRALLDA